MRWTFVALAVALLFITAFVVVFLPTDSFNEPAKIVTNDLWVSGEDTFHRIVVTLHDNTYIFKKNQKPGRKWKGGIIVGDEYNSPTVLYEKGRYTGEMMEGTVRLYLPDSSLLFSFEK